jgi:O-antigen biosynthesis protein
MSAGHGYSLTESSVDLAVSSELARLIDQVGDARPEELRARLTNLAGAVEELRRELDSERQNAARLRQVLYGSLENLEDRLAQVENSVLFKINRRIGGALQVRKRKLGQALLHSRFHSVVMRLLGRPDDEYRLWVERQEEALPSFEWHREQSRHFAFRPRISILMATHNPSRAWLDAAIESVHGQSYENWQLCICDDASDSAWVRERLTELSSADPRIRSLSSERKSGISGALNQAAALADGDYVGFLDHDDVLHAHCLHYIAEACQEPGVQVVYSDEDCLDASGRRVRPRFKPDWSPELLNSCMYWGHIFVVDRTCLEDISSEWEGWFRSSFDGAQDYDLALRLRDRPIVVRHVPRVLYHWRQHPESTAGNPSAKPYAHVAGLQALEQSLDRRNERAVVEGGEAANTFVVHRELTDTPLVSIVVCSRNQGLFDHLLKAVDKTTGYRNYEVVLVEHRTSKPPFSFSLSAADRLIRAPYFGPFNFSEMNNLGARAARGSILVFLNDDAEPLSPAWLEVLVAQLQRPEIGIVGARLTYPSGAIQHAGMALGLSDGAGHPGRGLFRSDLFPWLDHTRDVSAVTGACLGIRREVFAQLGGFDPLLPVNYNDVDVCLRARQRDYRVIYVAQAELLHRESATRPGGTRFRERVLFHLRWFPLLQHPDPYFPRALDPKAETIRLSGDPAR